MRSKKSKILFGLFILIFSVASSGSLGAQGVTKFYTLQSAIQEALANNWSLKAKGKKVDQAIDVKKQARADFLPKFSVTYSYNKRDEARGATITPTPGASSVTLSNDTYRFIYTLRQPLFTGFELLSRYRLAELGIDQSAMDLELEKLDLILNVKTAYFNILIADIAIRVAQSDIEFRESNLNVARNFYKVGMIPINEVLRAEVELADSQQALVRVQNSAKLARASFNTVLARPVNEQVELEDLSGYEPEKGNFDQYLVEALKNRPEIKLIDINILQADQQIRLAKSQYYPDVAFTYNYTREGDDPTVGGGSGLDPNSWEALAVAQWTFWEWGKTYYSAREKKSFKKELLDTKKALENNIGLELQQALLDLETAERNIPPTQKAVEQGEENLRVNEERYKAQVTTITEVLNAQTLLTQARVNYYGALYDHHLAKARLERAIGAE